MKKGKQESSYLCCEDLVSEFSGLDRCSELPLLLVLYGFFGDTPG